MLPKNDNNRNKLDTFGFGFIAGVFAPLLVFLIYYKINFDFIRLNSFIADVFLKNILAPLLSLCVIINLGIFYLFYWKYYNYAARGIIGATLFYALIVLIAKFVI